MVKEILSNKKYTPEIITNNPEQHKEGIEKQLIQLQVLFCDRLYQQYKNECKKSGKQPEKTFSDILEEQKAYYIGDLRMLEIIYSTKDLNENELYNLVSKKHYKILDPIYDQLPEGKIYDNSSEYIKSRISELNVLINYLETEQKKAKDEFPDKWREMTERPKDENGQVENMAGIIAYNSLEEKYGFDESQMKKSLEEEGFSGFKDFLEIHLPFQIGEQKFGAKAIQKSLVCLAEKIVDEHEKTHAIVAESWLLFHPLFQKFLKMKIIGQSSDNWRQLVGANGQIEQTRVKKLLSTGEMPYKNLIGYISVDEFLQEYLPNEKHRKI